MNPKENIEGESKEAVVGDEDDIEDVAFENGRCGICMYAVIDRGVLDCCHHWFCFECIDNWATITNCCPLCKNEFQLITCLPVYDTTGSIKAEEYSLSRDDDWCIQRNNNTLSFPSYYIDEDAVICLDGDGCKIRSGVSTAEDALTLDTSIACDSCEIWYHAFCVGFNPECTLENSWLCPRCSPVEVKQKLDCLSIQNLSKHSILRSAGHGSNIDPSFLGKVSVSVADAGETAVVVSMVGGGRTTEASSPSGNDPDINKGKETRTPLSDADASNPNLGVQLDQSGCVELMCKSFVCSDETGSIPLVPKIENSSEKLLDMSPKMDDIQPDVKLTENSLAYAASEMVVIQAEHDILNTSLDQSQDAMPFSSCDSVVHGGFQAKNTEENTHSPCHFNEYSVSCPFSSDSYRNENGQSENKCDTIPHLGISVISPSSAEDMITGTNEDMVHAGHQKDINSRGLTMKHTEKFQVHHGDMDHLSGIVGKRGDSQVRREDEHPAKRAKLNETSQVASSASQVNASVSENSQTCSTATAVPEDDYLRCAPYEEALTPDIMDIVRESKHRKHDGEAGIYPATKIIEKQDNAARLRVKKIMRRVGNKESSILFQELRKEITEIVKNENSNSTDEENAFDGKLLTAFRDAMVKPTNELANKLNPSVLGVRKSLLQKGKIRENLTKKIYGTSTGKRRRAWDRDWEIEFWKHRCSRMKPEKVETLQSVLELLRKASSSCLGNFEMDQGPEEATDSILSRVYLADASVFPRKDDIKPLSALAASSPVDNNQNVNNNNNKLSGKDSQNTDESAEAKNPKGISKGLPPFKVPSSDNTRRRLNAPSITGEAQPKTGSTPFIGGGQSSNEPANHPGSSKNDKRKWAQEVLARKNALANSSASKDQQENGAMLKGNYPLLAQLPVDMRPVPAPSRHNKVPVAVRQAQLYRITEYYLRKANLVVIRRTAETELAVADAVNVEKDIFERSNSKLVYINLCSQVLSQHAKSQAETITSHLTGHNGCGIDHLEKGAYEESGATVSSEAEEALRMAGLSDTPPNSPDRVVKKPNEEDPSVNVNAEGPEKILDVDSYPELDTYGELEYDLGDNGYIAHSIMPNASKVYKLQPEHEDSGMKAMLSTPKFEESDKFSDSDTLKPLCPVKEESTNDNLIVEAQYDSSTLLEYQKAHGAENANVNVRLNAPLMLEPSQGHKEPSLVEYEQLYGPEKEHLVNVTSDVAIGEGSNFMEMDAAAKSTIPQTENNNSKDGVTVFEFDIENRTENKALLDLKSSGGENSPTHSSMDENALKEGKSKSSNNKSPDSIPSISKKVEAFIKEHIRPLCKSGVITVEQYRWAVAKATDKVMRYHYKAKNANFLIKEGDKVKRLAEQYVEVAQLKEV